MAEKKETKAAEKQETPAKEEKAGKMVQVTFCEDVFADRLEQTELVQKLGLGG